MANVAKLRWNWSVAGINDVWCVAHVKADDSHLPITEPELDAIALAGYFWWTAPGSFFAAREMYGDLVRLQWVEAQRIKPTESDPVIYPAEGNAGSYLVGASTKYAPPQCSWLVGLRGLTSTRRTRGRLYLPAMLPPQADDREGEAEGRIDGVTMAFLGQTAAHLAEEIRNIGGVGSAEFVLATYSRVDGTAAARTHFHVNAYLMTQRRRVFSRNIHRSYGLDGVEGPL